MFMDFLENNCICD